MLYVYKAVSALDITQKEASNMKALGKVVRSLGTGVVLVVTGIPVEYTESNKLLVDRADLTTLTEYGNFLQSQRAKCEVCLKWKGRHTSSSCAMLPGCLDPS